MFACMSGEARTQPVVDEALRVAALQIIFPDTQISITSRKKPLPVAHETPTRDGIRYPDAFALESVYQVVGKPINPIEATASEDVASRTISNTRRVQLKLFRWPTGTSAGFLAVLQYDFSGVNPALCCASIGRLAHVVKGATRWELREDYLLRTSRHFGLQRIELLDLTGDGVDELVIESDFGAPGTSGSSLQVFDLSHGRLEELLNTNSRLEYETEEGYTQALDISRTLQTHGQQFCVIKTTLFEKDHWFSRPRVTSRCYQRGDGVDAEDSKFRQQMLAPLP